MYSNIRLLYSACISFVRKECVFSTVALPAFVAGGCSACFVQVAPEAGKNVYENMCKGGNQAAKRMTAFLFAGK